MGKNDWIMPVLAIVAVAYLGGFIQLPKSAVDAGGAGSPETSLSAKPSCIGGVTYDFAHRVTNDLFGSGISCK